jgi:hypothetical protein
MPAHRGVVALKAWRYIGVFGPEVMLCIGSVRIGRARQSFWAVWDRTEGRLHERTILGRPGPVSLRTGRALVADGAVRIDLHLDEQPGIESICPAGRDYAWTRKQGGIPATGTVELGSRRIAVDAGAVIDDTAAYYQRHTSWRWCAGVGIGDDGRAVAWNLVSGVNDPPAASERTVWVGSDTFEPPPSSFTAAGVDGLTFTEEAVRERRDNLLLIRSAYRQPFGTFAGVLPGGLALAEGWGVIETHEAWW